MCRWWKVGVIGGVGMKKFFVLILFMLLSNLCCFAKDTGLGIDAVRKESLWSFMPLQIRNVQPNSPAAKANIPIGYYIISINGQLTKYLPDYTCLELLNSSSKINLVISPSTDIYTPNTLRLEIFNEEGFSNIIKSVTRTKGIGLGVYKYDLNLSMPLLITNVEKFSPAEFAGLRNNSLILKINNQLTTDLTVSECIKLLNGKNVDLEVSDLRGNNIKKYKLKPKFYYGNEVKNVEKNWVLTEVIVTASQYNLKDKLLEEYFKTFSSNYSSNGMTNEEIFEDDIQKLNKPYLKFQENKNDMRFNKDLYDGLNTFISQYNQICGYEIETVKNILVSYGVLNTSASEKQVLDYITSQNINNSDYFINNIETFKHLISKWTAMAKEIKDYSVAYETKQKNTASKITTPYFIDNLDFRELLWGWQNTKSPQKNGIYIITPQIAAKILQSVPGGILVTSDVTSNARIIYIATKKQFVDEEWLKDGMVIVFDGFYSYSNAFGVNRKIYKFKEVSPAEYWNRVKQPMYYFIK